MATPPPPILLYDGTCGLCHGSVRFILRHERDHDVRFAPLQGATAAALRARWPEIPSTLETVVLVQDDQVYLRSRAFLYVAKHLRAPWRWLSVWRWLPAAVSDLGYRVVAATRYKIFGRADLCDLPAPDERARFMD